MTAPRPAARKAAGAAKAARAGSAPGATRAGAAKAGRKASDRAKPAPARAASGRPRKEPAATPLPEAPGTAASEAAPVAAATPSQAVPGGVRAVRSPSGLALVTDPTSVIPVYAGIVAVVAGFALIFISWSEVAAQSSVWLQMPFLLSTGFPGLGLIMAGLVLINVSVKRQDGARRTAQMAALTEAVTELRRALHEVS